MKTITFPDFNTLKPHQVEVINDPHKFKVLIWHRRARKTTTAIIEMARNAMARQGVYWHVFPTYSEAKDAVWRDPQMLFGQIPAEFIKRKNESELLLELVNGSIYQLKGADNADRLRGAGPKGLILDEFDTMKDDVWPILEPIIRQNNGWVWFVGTPKGKQKLFQLYNRGRDSDFREWKSWLLQADKSGIIPDDQLIEARRSMPQSLFNQEFMCDFLEGAGSVFRNVGFIMDSRPEPPVPGRMYVMGVDLAKVQDWTVVSIFDRESNRQVYQDRFQTLEWPFQKERIRATWNHYNRPLIVMDATGVGDPIVDDLIRSGLTVQPFKLTNESKKEIIEKLSIWIEQRKLHLIPLEESRIEYDNFSYEISSSGRIIYGARDNTHDDIIISHALAVSALQERVIDYRDMDLPPVQRHFLNLLNKKEEDPFMDYEAI